MKYTIKESLNNCDAPSVLICNLVIDFGGALGYPDTIIEGCGSTYEIARLMAYEKASHAICQLIVRP